MDLYGAESELPSSLRHFIAQAGMSGKFYAAYVPATGRIAYVASNIPSVTAAQRGFIEGLFQHEGRHKGFDLVFGSPAMKRAWFLQAAKSMGKDVQNWLSYYNLPDTPEGRAKAAEEIIVDWAKTGKVHRLVDRLLAKIAAWIRRAFPRLKMSYAEIRQMLARVDDWMESGEEAPRLIGPLEAEPAFGRGAGSEKNQRHNRKSTHLLIESSKKMTHAGNWCYVRLQTKKQPT